MEKPLVVDYTKSILGLSTELINEEGREEYLLIISNSKWNQPKNLMVFVQFYTYGHNTYLDKMTSTTQKQVSYRDILMFFQR